MADEALEVSLQATKRTQMIIWLAFVLEPLVYVILLWVVSAEQTEEIGPAVGPYLRWGFYALAVILAAASVILRRFLLSDRRLAVLRGEEASVLPRAPHWYLTASLASWGLNSFIPIGGVLLLIMGGDGVTILVLSAVAVLLNLLAYPQLDAFIDRVRGLSQDWGEG